MIYEETIQLKDEVSGHAATARAAVDSLAGSFLTAQASITDVGPIAKQALGEFADGFRALAGGDVQGAVEGATAGLASMAQLLDLVVPGLGQAASLAIKIAGGIVGITAGLIQSGMKFAIAAATEKQAMLSMFDAMGAGAVTGKELDDMLSELADSIGISKDKLAPLTKAFLQMGVTGKDQLEELTKAAISATAIVGEGGAEAFTALTKKIQLAAQTGQALKLDPKFMKMIAGAGLTIDDLAKSLGTTKDKLAGTSVDAAKLGDALTKGLIEKGAKPLERMGSTLDNIWGKFLQDVGDWFEDIDVGPFLKEVKDLFGIFATSKPSGETLKTGIQAFFQKTFDIAAQLVPVVKHFLLDLIIYGLKAYIALKPTLEKIQELWNQASEAGVLKAAFYFIVGALAAVAAAVLIVVAVIGTLMAISIAVGLAIWGTIAAVVAFAAYLGTELAGAGEAVVEWLTEAWNTINEMLGGWPQAALDAALAFVQGIVDGISSGAGMVWDAVKALAGGVVDGIKSALGIASPSKVAFSLMEDGFGGGMVGGLGSAANDVHEAASDVGDAAAAGVKQGAGAGGDGPEALAMKLASTPSGAAGGGKSPITVYATINIDGAGKTAEEITTELVVDTFEVMALASGL